MADAPKLLLDFQELADALGVHLATVYRMRDRGELPIPILHLGRSPRVRTIDVERWLEDLAEDASDITAVGPQKRTPAGHQSTAGAPSISRPGRHSHAS
jgi:excisionase family DNA binding protein